MNYRLIDMYCFERGPIFYPEVISAIKNFWKKYGLKMFQIPVMYYCGPIKTSSTSRQLHKNKL